MSDVIGRALARARSRKHKRDIVPWYARDKRLKWPGKNGCNPKAVAPKSRGKWARKEGIRALME